MCNNYKIVNITEAKLYVESRKHEAHKTFRIKLIKILYDCFERLTIFLNEYHDYSKKLTLLICYTFVIKHKRITKLINKNF